MGEQISIKGKDDIILSIKKGYNQLGLKVSPRMTDLALNDIKHLLEDNSEYNMEMRTIDYDMDKIEREFTKEVNFFESILKKIKTKIYKNDNPIEHFEYFEKFLIELGIKLEKEKDTLKNYKALRQEMNTILELIESLKEKNTLKILQWYGKYKKSDVMYEILKSEGMTNTDITEIQMFINKKRTQKRKRVLKQL